MLNELKTVIASRLTGDATLTALLGTSSSVFCKRPPAIAALPLIVISASEKPDPEASVLGQHEVELRLDSYAESAASNDSIAARLDVLLYDAHRGGLLDTTNYRTAFCRRLSSRVASSDVRQSVGREVEKRETVWRIILLKKTA